MARADDKTYPFAGVEAIDVDVLETIPYSLERVDYDAAADPPLTIVPRSPEHRAVPAKVRYDSGEFSAVCPYSGLPDYGRITIEYVPLDWLVELKSLKYYLTSYRMVGIYQEHATVKIYEDLWELLSPRRLRVRTAYHTRGGIDSTCTIDSEHASRQRSGEGDE